MNIKYNEIKILKDVFKLKTILFFTFFTCLSINIYPVDDTVCTIRKDLIENILKYSNHILVEFNNEKKDYDSLISSVDSFFDFFMSNSNILKYSSENSKDFKEDLYNKILNKEILDKQQLQKIIEDYFKELEASYDQHENAVQRSNSRKILSKYKVLTTLALGLLGSGFYFKFGKKNKDMTDDVLDYVSDDDFGIDDNSSGDSDDLDSNLHLAEVLEGIPIQEDDSGCLSLDSDVSSDSESSSDSDDSDEHFSRRGRKLVPSELAKRIWQKKLIAPEDDRLSLRNIFGKRNLKKK